MKSSAIATVATATGTLIKKMIRHVARPISQPPRSGPTTVEMPLHAVHVPIAAPRSGPLKDVVITASDAGVSSAPAIPWIPRKTMSSVIVGATAQRTDATPNDAAPIVNIRV